MPRLLVACCDRCGSARNDGDWTESNGQAMHVCPDGRMGGEGTYDVADPSSRPQIEGVAHIELGQCPNCSKQLIQHAYGYPACLSCGTYGVEPKTWQIPFGNWRHACDSTGKALLTTIGCGFNDVSFIIADHAGCYINHQLTTDAEKRRRDQEGPVLRHSQLVETVSAAVHAATLGVPVDASKIAKELDESDDELGEFDERY